MTAQNLFFTINTNKLSKAGVTSLVTFVAVVSTGCQSIDLREVAYSALRHEDCRRNEIDTFCARSARTDFHEYDRIRTEYLTDTSGQIEAETPWANPTETTSQPQASAQASTAL